MTTIFAIAWKDLRSTVRDVPALVLMLAAPLALAALLGLAFGGGESFEIARVKVAVADLDREAGAGQNALAGRSAGAILQGVLVGADLADVLEARVVDSAAAARRVVDDGDAAAAVIVPEDFSAVVFGSDPAASVQVEVYENPTSEIGGPIVEGVVGQVLAEFNGARAAAAGAAYIRSHTAGDQPPEEVATAAAEAFGRGGGISSGLRIDHRSPRVGKGGNEVGVVGFVLAGMMVFFMFFGAANVARTILTEDRDGTLSRLFTTPARHGVVIGGKFVSVFTIVFLQAVVLIVAGRLVFAIDWGRPDVIIVLTLAAAGVAAGLALLVIAFARTPAQAGAVGSGVYLVLALLGGNFTGTPYTSGVYGVVQRLTPNGWLIRGWDVAMRGGTLADVRWQLLPPLAFAVVFFLLAVLKIRRRFA